MCSLSLKQPKLYKNIIQVSNRNLPLKPWFDILHAVTTYFKLSMCYVDVFFPMYRMTLSDRFILVGRMGTMAVGKTLQNVTHESGVSSLTSNCSFDVRFHRQVSFSPFRG